MSGQKLSKHRHRDGGPGLGPRVLFFNRSYWPDAEATGQLLTELCEDLAGQFDVTVVAGQPNHNPSRATCRSWGRDSRRGVSIRRVPHLRFAKRSLVGRAVNMLTYLAGAAVSAFFAPRPDVVVVETDPFLLPILGRVLAWRHRARLVVYLQDIYPDVAVALGKVRDGAFTRILRRWLFAIYRRANRVVVLGEDMRELLTRSEIPEERITVLPNWSDTTRVYPVRENNAFRQRQNLGGQFVVMYSGNMGLCQSLDDVLDAAARLRARSEILFLMVGDGASRPRLEYFVRRHELTNVRFLPYQPQSDLASSLSAADLHLVPLDARVTGCLVPSKLYGILAAGVPALVIADRRCETSRVVERTGTGRVVAPGDSELLAEAIDWCASHRDELAIMGARARRLAETEYDRKIATGRFGQLLHEVIDGPASESAAELASVPSDMPPLPLGEGRGEGDRSRIASPVGDVLAEAGTPTVLTLNHSI
jgi:glycosyltransferase involved in cell wall biosynthesis